MRFKTFELWDLGQKNYLGFVVLKSARKPSQNRHFVSLLDYVLLDAAYEKWLYPIAIQFAQTENVKELEYASHIFHLTNHPFLPLSLKRKEARTYFIREGKSDSPFAAAAPVLTAHYCDGDTAFT